MTEVLRGSWSSATGPAVTRLSNVHGVGRHGPVWELTVTLGRGRTTGESSARSSSPRFAPGLKTTISRKITWRKISESNRELFWRGRPQKRKD
jgi:hypothetical protein